MASKITDFYTQRKSMKNDDMLCRLFSKLDLLQKNVEKIQSKQKEIEEAVIRIGKKSSENSKIANYGQPSVGGCGATFCGTGKGL